MNRVRAIYKRPLYISLVVAGLTLALTQFLVYTQYRLLAAARKERLVHELNIVEDRFRGILLSDITAANTLAVFYKYCEWTENFDIVAQDIMARNKYVEALQITEGGIIKKVYPLKGYEQTIGINTLRDSMLVNEANNALKRGEIYFVGPRPLRVGGVGILGKVPIIVGGKLVAISVVLTKLPTIVSALRLSSNSSSEFAYELKKVGEGEDTSKYFLTGDSQTKAVKLSPKKYRRGTGCCRLLTVKYTSLTSPYSVCRF